MQTTRRWKRSEQQSCRLPCRDQLRSRCLQAHRACDAPGCRRHILQVIPSKAEHITHTQMKLSSSWTLLQVEFHYLRAENSPPGTAQALLWAPFQQASPRSFSSTWQNIQPSTAARDTCAGTKPFQLKATYVSEPALAHGVVDRIFSRQVYPQLWLTCITSIPILKGIMWR